MTSEARSEKRLSLCVSVSLCSELPSKKLDDSAVGLMLQCLAT